MNRLRHYPKETGAGQDANIKTRKRYTEKVKFVKTITNYFANYFRFPLFILSAAFALAVGCAAPKPVPTPSPLEGWKLDLVNQPDQAIVADYKNYILQMPPEEGKYAQGPFWFLKDGKGQQAITFEIPLNNVLWEHVLIYDKDNRRVKAIKYSNGHYRS
jgi:hypothetical protein